MTVPELRKQIIARIKPARTSNGKPVYCLPDGKIVSKAKKSELEAYLAAINAVRVVTPERTLTQLEQVVARCNNRIKKYSKRRPRPNNFKLLGQWTDRQQKAIIEIGQLTAEAA